MVIRRMDELDSETARWMNNEFTRIYAHGGIDGSITADFTWSQEHFDAVRLLAQDFMDDVLSATKYVRKDVKRFVREAASFRIQQGVIQGDVPRTTALEIKQLLQERGIAAITYKDGSRHGLDEYTRMLTRTKTAQAYNTGTLTQAASEGVKFWEIIDGPECGLSFHDDPMRAAGMIVDRHTCDKFIISHPNCRRSFAPRPDIGTKKDLKTAQPFGTEEQRRDIRRMDIQRQRRALRAQTRQATIRGRSRNPAFQRRRV